MITNQCQPWISRFNARYLSLFVAAAATGCLALISCTPAAAHEHKIKLIICGKEVSLSTPLFADHDGDIYAPAEVFEAMGYTTKLSGDQRSMTIEDWRTSINWPTNIHNGHPLVELAQVTSALNAGYNFDQDSRTVTILAKVLLVREDSDKLSVSTSFPVPVRTQDCDNPSRVYMDLSGATLTSSNVSIPVSGDDISAVRAAQTNDSSVRIVVDLKRKLAYKQISSAVPNHYELSLVGGSVKTALMPTVPQRTIPMALAIRKAIPTPSRVIVVNVPSPTLTADTTTGQSPDSSDVTQPHIQNITYAQGSGSLTVFVDVTPSSDSASTPYHAFLLDNPDRLAFDIPGADFNLPPAITEPGNDSLDITSDVASRLRWGTTDPATMGAKSSARIVLDLSHDVEYQVSSSGISGGMVRYTISVENSEKPVAIAQVPYSAPHAAVAPSQPNSSETIISPSVISAPASVIVGVANAGDDAASKPADTGSSAAVTPTPAPTVTPEVSIPPAPVPDSVLSGKTIVVDPGHGGKDTGAPGVHGVLEKNVVLQIGKILRDDLVACGAKVVMTRADDTFIPLAARSQMGEDYHADYFVSVHADSSGVENSHSGTTVYYHSNNPVCLKMAESIAQRLGQLDDGIKADGVRSDFVRFPGVGFSVLRNSKEPAVLVETGYVDSDNDCSHLTDSDTQHAIALAIVAGLKDYASQNASTAKLPTAHADPNTIIALAYAPAQHSQ